MKITNKDQAIHTTKPEGVEVWYYLFPEYEIHYNEQRPHTTQAWHFHEKIHESIFVIEGQLEAKWKEGEQEKSRIIAEATGAAEKIVAQAALSAEQETVKARNELRAEAARLAVDLASGKLGGAIKKNDHDRFVGEYLDKVVQIQ